MGDGTTLEDLLQSNADAVDRWNQAIPLLAAEPFPVHIDTYRRIFGNSETEAVPWVWTPSHETFRSANATRFAEEHGFTGFDEVHRWSTADPDGFWAAVADWLEIEFGTPPTAGLGPSEVEHPHWFPNARLNAVDSCFTGSLEAIAIRHQRNGAVHSVTYRELLDAVNRFANGFVAAGFEPGDAIAIAMPMNLEAVVAYLGIIKAGGIVVSIADSFAAPEIATRLKIAAAVGIVTQHRFERLGRTLPMYAKVIEARAPRAIVVGDPPELRAGDVRWDAFQGPADPFESVQCGPDAHTNILFSSGTTGDPKAIPWSHTTPVKAAADGNIHQDIRPEDTVAWPTNLGWMMGPWLIYATLINGASIALFDDAPTAPGFRDFVHSAGVTVLGVVPSLVRAWRAAGWLENCEWNAVRVFTSTGEPSNPEDMLYLMAMGGYAPVIEYCGGTEIGGGYITGTVVQPQALSAFSTPGIGWSFLLLDAAGIPADTGEVWLVPPALGMSVELLNRDHHEVYYAGSPTTEDGTVLRRHGDQMERLPNGYYRALGRVDDTMNLGGIKVSSAEIERCIDEMPGVRESAAVSVPSDGGGPERLVVFAVLDGDHDQAELLAEMRDTVRDRLNPLFKIDELIPVSSLPRTASNKIMRRELRSRL